MLNSFWRKFGERQNKATTVTVHEPSHFFSLLTDDTLEIYTIRLCTEDVLEVVHTSQDEAINKGSKVNIFIASFTTCHARLKLYEALHSVQDQVLYYETDSVIYRGAPELPSIPVGDYLGEMTDELEGDVIVEFVSGGAKNYGYRTRGGKAECKVRGFTLNHHGASILNFDPMKRNILSEIDDPKDKPRHLKVTNPHHFARDTSAMTIGLTKRVKQYELVFDKRVLSPLTRTSVPFGYQHITDEVEMLTSL